MVKKSCVVPAIFFYLGSATNKNKQEDDLKFGENDI